MYFFQKNFTNFWFIIIEIININSLALSFLKESNVWLIRCNLLDSPEFYCNLHSHMPVVALRLLYTYSILYFISSFICVLVVCPKPGEKVKVKSGPGCRIEVDEERVKALEGGLRRSTRTRVQMPGGYSALTNNFGVQLKYNARRSGLGSLSHKYYCSFTLIEQSAMYTYTTCKCLLTQRVHLHNVYAIWKCWNLAWTSLHIEIEKVEVFKEPVLQHVPSSITAALYALTLLRIRDHRTSALMHMNIVSVVRTLSLLLILFESV